MKLCKDSITVFLNFLFVVSNFIYKKFTLLLWFYAKNIDGVAELTNKTPDEVDDSLLAHILLRTTNMKSFYLLKCGKATNCWILQFISLFCNDYHFYRVEFCNSP